MFTRHAEAGVRAALADTPVVLVHGPRQAGKTTLVRHLSAGTGRRQYVTFDDAGALASADRDPDGFVAGFDGPVTLDEVQHTPAIFRAIKASVDRDRRPGRFLLTGSANVLMLPTLSESLAGRIEIVTLWPLSQAEIQGRLPRFIDVVFANGVPSIRVPTDAGTPLEERIIRGGYPEPIERGGADRRDRWFASYVTTILQRDVRDLANIERVHDIPRLLSLIATRVGGLLNYSDLSRSLSMSASTLRRYFVLLETTFMVVTIPSWSNNLGLRVTKSPKIVLADTGLACHLMRVDAERLGVDGRIRGALTENFVAMEILKQAPWSAARPSLHHFRTPSGREVDLVLEERSGRIVGVEVKNTAGVNSDDFTGLRALRDAAGARFHRGVVLYTGTHTLPFGDRLWAMPIHSLWGE